MQSNAVESQPMLPAPGSLRTARAPHWRTGGGGLSVTAVLLLAVLPAHAAGLVLFGWSSLRILAIASASALLVNSLLQLLRGRARSPTESQALLIGVLLAATLPPTVPWQVPLAGAVISIVVAGALLGGVGNYLWNPVALGHVAVQMLFASALSTPALPVLASDHLLWGDVQAAGPLPTLTDWRDALAPEGVQAWLVASPIELLRRPAPDPATSGPEAAASLVRDDLPFWPDMLLGLAGGPIGGACVGAVMLGGFLLMWRGLLRPSLALAGLAAAALAAAVLPLRYQTPGGTLESYWLPVLATWDGWPVGAAYVVYSITVPDLLLVLLLVAPDPSSSPLTSRGHLVFGGLIGVIAVALRIGVGLPAAAYWALLAANTAVPLIDRLTRRRVLGT